MYQLCLKGVSASLVDFRSRYRGTLANRAFIARLIKSCTILIPYDREPVKLPDTPVVVTQHSLEAMREGFPRYTKHADNYQLAQDLKAIVQDGIVIPQERGPEDFLVLSSLPAWEQMELVVAVGRRGITIITVKDSPWGRRKSKPAPWETHAGAFSCLVLASLIDDYHLDLGRMGASLLVAERPSGERAFGGVYKGPNGREIVSTATPHSLLDFLVACSVRSEPDLRSHLDILLTRFGLTGCSGTTHNLKRAKDVAWEVGVRLYPPHRAQLELSLVESLMARVEE